jgi:hypothetical protein
MHLQCTRHILVQELHACMSFLHVQCCHGAWCMALTNAVHGLRRRHKLSVDVQLGERVHTAQRGGDPIDGRRHGGVNGAAPWHMGKNDSTVLGACLNSEKRAPLNVSL